MTTWDTESKIWILVVTGSQVFMLTPEVQTELNILIEEKHK